MNPAAARGEVERRQAPARAVHRERRSPARGMPGARDHAGPTRALIACGAPPQTSFGLGRLAMRVLQSSGVECELLDLGLPDAAAELAERCATAHGVLIVAAAAAEPLIERLAGAGLAGCAYGLVVPEEGDAGGAERVRRGLADRLDGLGLIDAGAQAQLDRFTGYYTPHAPGELERDGPLQEEVRGTARAMTHVMGEIRAGRLSAPDLLLARPHRANAVAACVGAG